MIEITIEGSPLKIVGHLPKVGVQAPDFTVTKTDLSEISLKNYFGKKIVLNIFPSLDTKTCAMAMKRFNEIAEEIPNILILCISADLPFAQKRFCATEHLDNIQPVSVFRHPEFGRNYGVLITTGVLAGLLARTVIVIDEKGYVNYVQQVHELVDEPNYQEIIDILHQ